MLSIGNYEMSSPLMNAGGLVKSVEDVRLMAQTGVGAVLAGSFTLDERVGNSPNGEQVYFHDPANSITYNSLGMPNKGLRTMAKDIPTMVEIAHDYGKPFILNFAPVTSDPVREINQAFYLLAKADVELDGFELNASCPNVILDGGRRHDILSANPTLFSEVLGEISDMSRSYVPIGTRLTRISPLRDFDDVPNLMSALQGHVQVISAFNTFPGGHPRRPDGSDHLQVVGGIGGMSGPGMATKAEQQTRVLVAARDAHLPEVEIIGSTGIATAEALKRRLDLGVAAVSATTLFWEGRNWATAVDSLLRHYVELTAD